jgi:hypothetical protein
MHGEYEPSLGILSPAVDNAQMLRNVNNSLRYLCYMIRPHLRRRFEQDMGSFDIFEPQHIPRN